MSFLEGIDLSEAAKVALTADLELRRKDQRTADRFYRYAFQGGADLCLKHGQFWPGRVRPAKYEHLRGPIGQCFGNSRAACQADSSLTYVEGYCTSGAGYAVAHGWCVDAEGVVDLTLPCGADEIAEGHRSARTGLPFLHPSKWGYYGVRFTNELVTAHWHALGLPMLDRSTRETADYPPGDLNYREPHDFPLLKVSYDRFRTEMPPYTEPAPLVQDEDEWDDDDDEEDEDGYA